VDAKVPEFKAYMDSISELRGDPIAKLQAACRVRWTVDPVKAGEIVAISDWKQY
jgi:hypothetical protein